MKLQNALVEAQYLKCSVQAARCNAGQSFLHAKAQRLLVIHHAKAQRCKDAKWIREQTKIFLNFASTLAGEVQILDFSLVSG